MLLCESSLGISARFSDLIVFNQVYIKSKAVGKTILYWLLALLRDADGLVSPETHGTLSVIVVCSQHGKLIIIIIYGPIFFNVN